MHLDKDSHGRPLLQLLAMNLEPVTIFQSFLFLHRILTRHSATNNDNNTPIASPYPRYGMDGQAIEPAVQYVQKIKQRCDPDTYRQFLDILSRYRHTPDTVDEVCCTSFRDGYLTQDFVFRNKFQNRLPCA